MTISVAARQRVVTGLWGGRKNGSFAGRAPAVTAALTGTATAGITESDIRGGGYTIIITLTNDTWVAAGASFDAQRQAIIDGLDSGQAEATGWDAVVKAGLAVGAVVRTSDTVVTITLSAFPTYDITAQETITATVPNAALVTSATPVVASPTFTVDVVTPTPVPPVFTPGEGAGTRKRGDKGIRVRRQRIILRLEGKEYELNSLQEVLDVIKAAKKDVPALANVKAREIISTGKRIGDAKKEDPGIEVVSAPSSVREIIDDRIAEMERFYWARIAAQIKAMEDDEDDAWLMM